MIRTRTSPGTHHKLIVALGGPWRAALIAVLLIGGVAVHYRMATALLIGMAVAIPLERRWRRHPFGAIRPGLGTDLLHFLISNTLKNAAILAAAALSWLLLHPVHLQPVSDALDHLPEIGRASCRERV